MILFHRRRRSLLSVKGLLLIEEGKTTAIDFLSAPSFSLSNISNKLIDLSFLDPGQTGGVFPPIRRKDLFTTMARSRLTDGEPGYFPVFDPVLAVDLHQFIPIQVGVKHRLPDIETCQFIGIHQAYNGYGFLLITACKFPCDRSGFAGLYILRFQSQHGQHFFKTAFR